VDLKGLVEVCLVEEVVVEVGRVCGFNSLNLKFCFVMDII